MRTAVLLCYYVASSGNYLPTFRDNLLILYFNGQESKQILITRKDVFLWTTFCFSLGRMDSHNILDQCFNGLIACILVNGRKCTRRSSSLHYLEIRDPYGRLHSAPSVCVCVLHSSPHLFRTLLASVNMQIVTLEISPGDEYVHVKYNFCPSVTES